MSEESQGFIIRMDRQESRMKICFAPFLASALLVMIAHGAGAEAPFENAPGVLETSIGRFVLTPRVCALNEEDGMPDIELEGVGVSPDGEPFYFEFSSTGNELAIRPGIEVPFVNSDREIRAGQYVTEAFDIQVDGDVLHVPVLLLADQNGDLLGTATLVVDCTPRE